MGYRLGFAGSTELSVSVLSALMESPHELVGVLSQPDRPAGRGRRLTANPLASYARKQNIGLIQPQSLVGDAVSAKLRSWNLDILIVVAYGLIVPESMLSIPRYGCWNVHVSLLPRWRGAAPIQRSILAGDKKTGISIMQMDAGLDTGNILQMSACNISVTDTSATLCERLAVLGQDLLLEVLHKQQKTPVIGEPQADVGVTYAEKVTKAEAAIDWSKSGDMIDRQIRAFNPAPMAFTGFLKDRIRIASADVVYSVDESIPFGKVIGLDKGGLLVKAGQGAIRIMEMQFPGKKMQSVKSMQASSRVLALLGGVFL